MSNLPPLQTGISNEEWRNISEFPNYQVSNIGRVRESITGRILPLHIKGKGYIGVSLKNNERNSHFYVHRLVAIAFIENPMIKPFVDHINRVKTDNTITNLRWSTQSENEANKPKRSNTSSSFIGVSWNRQTKKWMACIRINKRNKYLGYYSNEIDAARAYNNAAIQHHREFAVLNPIPDDDTNTDSQDNDSPELTPTSDYEEFNAESGDVEEDVD